MQAIHELIADSQARKRRKADLPVPPPNITFSWNTNQQAQQIEMQMQQLYNLIQTQQMVIQELIDKMYRLEQEIERLKPPAEPSFSGPCSYLV